jgi:hypothetical protein
VHAIANLLERRIGRGLPRIDAKHMPPVRGAKRSGPLPDRRREDRGTELRLSEQSCHLLRLVRREVVAIGEHVAGCRRAIHAGAIQAFDRGGRSRTGTGIAIRVAGKEDVRERGGRSLAIAIRVCGEVRLQLGRRRLRWRVLVLTDELHLLDEPASDDLVVLIQVQRQGLAEQHLILEVLLHEGLSQVRSRLDAELQPVGLGQLIHPLLRHDHTEPVVADGIDVRRANQHGGNGQKMGQWLTKDPANERPRGSRRPPRCGARFNRDRHVKVQGGTIRDVVGFGVLEHSDPPEIS